MATALDGLTYAAGQAARVGWFFGNALVTARLSRGTYPRPRERFEVPETRAILRDVAELARRDWANIAAGVYRMPHDLVRPPGDLLAEARAYFRELPQVNRRRQRLGHDEVTHTPPPGMAALPEYFVQNFHFQSDGYLSEHSARLYDYQVEVLFRGAADMMRRQVLVPIHHYVQRRAASGWPAGGMRLLDLGTGTGQFLTFVKDNHPRVEVTALDLSVPYLTEARRRLARWSRVRFVQAAAEAIPAPDASMDLVTAVFLFHELPRPVREQVTAEAARVLKPGGRFVLIDSIQRGDRPDWDGVLGYFPQAYHEPYYDDYTRHDLIAMGEAAGLCVGAVDLAFMSKVVVLDKPAAA